MSATAEADQRMYPFLMVRVSVPEDSASGILCRGCKVHKASRVNQANISITATRWCNRRCTHCYIDPAELGNPTQMDEAVFRSVFDSVAQLVALDTGLQEVEWELIGGDYKASRCLPGAKPSLCTEQVSRIQRWIQNAAR